MITIKYIIENCGLKCRKGSEGTTNTYKTILNQAILQGDILLDKKYKYPPRSPCDGLPYIVNSINFDEIDNFTKLTEQEFDGIIKNNPNHNKEIMMGVYLYIKSYYHPYTSVNRPIGFYQSIHTICETLGHSRKNVMKVLEELTKKQLLLKHYVGSRYTDTANKIRKNVPNIYIPNLGQSQEEIDETIKSTIAAMKDYYGVDEFLPFMQNLKEE